jgi:hypothetical protein
MKNEISPKNATITIAVIVVAAACALYFFTQGQADRSGPRFEINFHGKNAMKPPPGTYVPGQNNAPPGD